MVIPDLRAGAAGARASMADALCLATLIVANVSGQALGAVVGAGLSRRRL